MVIYALSRGSAIYSPQTMLPALGIANPKQDGAPQEPVTEVWHTNPLPPLAILNFLGSTTQAHLPVHCQEVHRLSSELGQVTCTMRNTRRNGSLQ